MNLKDTLSSYLNHRYAVLQRRTTFRLNKIEARLNLLAGFLIVFLNIDEVIQIIRNEDEPKQELMKRFNLNDIQAEAILNMRLRALRKLEEMELKREYDELEAEKQSKQALLNDPNLQTTHLVNEVKALKKYFLKDPRGERKSAIIENSIELNLNINDFIEKEPITIVCSKKGWIKSVKGHIADNSEHKYKEGDSEGYVLHAHTTDKLIAFTSVGKSYTLTCDKLPGGRGFGDPLRLMVEMAPSEELIYLFVAPQTSEHFLVASSEGRGFKVDSMQLISQTRNGKHILNIAEGAKATHCIPCNSTHIAIIGENRKLAIFTTAEIPTMNRGRGVILQKYLQGGISDIQCFNDTDGLKWKYGSGVKTETALDRWKVKRGQAGRLAPNGFPRSNKFK